MADQKVINKIANLLELADADRGGTEAERETATAMAHKLMLKYNIEQSEISGRSAKGDVSDNDHVVEGSMAEWKMKLPIFLAPACFCSGYYQQLGRFKWRVVLVGRPENILFVRTLSEYLIPWLETEASSAFSLAKKEADEGWGPEVKPRSFRRAFYEAATIVIVKRLEAERQEVTGNGMELVRNEEAANKQYLEDKNVRVKEQNRRGYSSAAGEALGGQAGLRADLATPQGKAVE